MDGDERENDSDEFLASVISDVPLSNPSADRLGRTQFARMIARAILNLNASEGFVIGITGPWGSGKSSAINFVLHYLSSESVDELITVHFNPWWFTGQDQLVAQFLQQFQAVLGQPNRSEGLRHAGKALRAFSSILRITSVIPGIGQALQLPGQLIGNAGDVLDDLSVINDRDLYQRRRDVDAALAGENVRILVVIDDIDRLQPSEILQVFSLVRSVADFPNTIYLLAFDREVVARSIEQVHPGDEMLYLDKIVQFRFDIPVPDRTSLKQMLLDGLQRALMGTPTFLWDPQEWGVLLWFGVEPLIRTPRNVSRLLAGVSVGYPHARGDVNVVDFVGLECLRLFVPIAYDWVVSSRELLIGRRGSADDAGYHQNQYAAFHQLINRIDAADRSPTATILACLFPQWANLISSGMAMLPTWPSQRLAANRIADPRNFDHYLQMRVPWRLVELDEARAIIALADNPVALNHEMRRLLIEKGPLDASRFFFFTETLREIVDDVPLAHVPDFLSVLLDVSEDYRVFEVQHELDVAKVPPVSWCLMVFLPRLMERIPSLTERSRAALDGFTQSSSVYLVATLWPILSPNDEYNETVVSSVVTQPVADELRQLSLIRIEVAFDSGSITAIPEFGHLLSILSEAGHDPQVREFATDLLRTDRGLATYLSGFVFKAYVQPVLDEKWGEAWHWLIRVSEVRRFIAEDVDELAYRSEAILSSQPDWLTGIERRALEAFIREVREPTYHEEPDT